MFPVRTAAWLSLVARILCAGDRCFLISTLIARPLESLAGLLLALLGVPGYFSGGMRQCTLRRKAVAAHHPHNTCIGVTEVAVAPMRRRSYEI